MVKGKRYTKAWFKGKQAAKAAEVKRREDVEKKQELEATGDMALLDLLNLRLDYLLDRAYSESHYRKTKLAAQRLLEYFGKVPCSAITRLKADDFLMAVVKERTPVTGNNDLKVLQKLCRDAGVDHHTFHRFRASSASLATRTGGARKSIWKSSATWNATPWTSTKGKAARMMTSSPDNFTHAVHTR